ncbi:hypothetical protein PABG_11139 [Paracoccidioides brasiliensis Pb03]|nr:hypothetical protein PABG_11139 [Paracoccidioides brasiliensis Pb03]
MRLDPLPLLPLLLTSARAAVREDYSDNTDTSSPFHLPLFDRNNNNHNNNGNPIFIDSRNAKEAVALERRQNQCPAGFNSCALLGAAGACCQSNAVCSRDDANHIACCPSGSMCTGKLTVPSQTTSTNFMFPQPGTATTTPPLPPTPTAPGTASVVPNAPYPFTVIPTTFPNQEACVTAYSGCQAQFSSCTAALGGVHGVTVGGWNGQGITVAGYAPTAGNPQSVCSSLSTAACHGLQVGYCTAFRGGVGSGGIGRNGGWSGNGLLYDIAAGVVVAVAGMIV